MCVAVNVNKYSPTGVFAGTDTTVLINAELPPVSDCTQRGPTAKFHDSDVANAPPVPTNTPLDITVYEPAP